jgi:hypothetical protein
MLRFLILFLLFANGTYFAWSQGMLAAWGFAPASSREPERVAQQVRPEAIRVLRAEEVRRIEAMSQAPVKATECLLVASLDDAKAAALRQALETSQVGGAWAFESANEPGRWIVYMGKYTSAQALAAKRSELASLNLKFEPLNNPALEPGLSLGNFASQAQAESALASLAKRGVRTAKVLQERPDAKTWVLKFTAVDDALRLRLDELKPLLDGRAFRACS